MLNKAGLCCCIHCKDEKSSKGIFCHVDRAHLGATQYSTGYNGKYENISNQAQIKRDILVDDYNKNPIKCKECGVPHSYEKRNNSFCNHSCFAVYNNRQRQTNGWIVSLEQRKRVSEKLSGRKYVQPVSVDMVCKECNNIFTFIKQYHNRNKKFCSRSCTMKVNARFRNSSKRADRSALINYRADSSFRFNLKDFPTEFDFLLVTEYGWYKPSNKGNNLTGVSRDHMVSVRWGFDNNIPAEHISHPANCRLIKHGDNSSKGIKNFITYDELLIRIMEWDNKYNE